MSKKYSIEYLEGLMYKNYILLCGFRDFPPPSKTSKKGKGNVLGIIHFFFLFLM